MHHFFSNLSINRKILSGLAVLAVLSLLATGLGAFHLDRIAAISRELTPHTERSKYLSNLSTTFHELEKAIESYATVGGEENKEWVLEEAEAIAHHAGELSRLTPSATEELGKAEMAVSSLRKDIDTLIILVDALASRGLNEQISLLYGSIRGLEETYKGVEEQIQTGFSAALKDQERRVGVAVAQFIVIELTILVCGALVSLWLSRAITAPVLKLRDAASKLAGGDYAARADIVSADEIGVLASTFNQMAEKLARYTTHLEAEVSARTDELKLKIGELDKSNQLLTKREAELTLVNERLQELDKAKSEFISVAAHQLRTPLSAIKWTLSLLIDENTENLNAEQRSLLMKGYESNERIINLINEMLVVTRLESGKAQYSFAPIHMEDLIDSVLLDFSGQTHVRKMKLNFEKPKESIPYIEADGEKLRGVLQNIIENAVRYTPDGGAITITAALESGMVKVGVKDTGIGIPSRQQASIFNKFFRADNAVKTQTDGSGLGLFVARAIVEKHGGKIWFESSEGLGTTFYFTVPVAKRPEAPSRPSDVAAEAPAPAAAVV